MKKAKKRSVGFALAIESLNGENATRDSDTNAGIAGHYPLNEIKV